MNRLVRKETLYLAINVMILLIMISAPVVISVFFPLSAVLLCVADIVCVFGVLNEDISPAYKLGIAVPMLLFPLHGALFRLVFAYGRAVRHLGRRTAGIFTDSRKTGTNDDNDRLRAYLTAKGFELYRAEDVKYYPTGDMMFSEMLECVRNARESIFLEFFIVAEGTALDELTEALAGRAAAGVDVRFLIDGTGSAFTKPKDYIRRLRSLGIRVLEFVPFAPASLSAVNISDHRKILAVDGKYAFCGGINIADEYMNRKVRFGKWKDGGVLVKGSAAAGFVRMFRQMWELSGGGKIPEIPVCGDSGGINVQPFGDVPLNGCRVSLSVYLEIIHRARKYLYVTTPYLVCDDEIIGALCTAAQCGVDVRLIVPGIPDKKYVNVITRSYYEKLIANNVHVYEYRNGFIHCKNIICDSELAAVGTVNLDYRSFSENFECGCVFFDRETAEMIKRDIDITFTECDLVTAENVKRLTWFVKVARIFLKLLAPLM